MKTSVSMCRRESGGTSYRPSRASTDTGSSSTGAVRFRDKGGDEFPFAYGKTVSDCRKMMERGFV